MIVFGDDAHAGRYVIVFGDDTASGRVSRTMQHLVVFSRRLQNFKLLLFSGPIQYQDSPGTTETITMSGGKVEATSSRGR